MFCSWFARCLPCVRVVDDAKEDLARGFRAMGNLPTVAQRNVLYERVRWHVDVHHEREGGLFRYMAFRDHMVPVNEVLRALEMEPRLAYVVVRLSRADLLALALRNEYQGGIRP